MGYPMVCMDARRAADAIKSRRVKSDKGDARALAEMLRLGGKRTAVMDDAGRIVWRGTADTHPELVDAVLERFKDRLAKVGLESGPFTPHLFRSLAAMGYPMVCMDARRAADAITSRRVKSDKGDARALAEMLRTGGGLRQCTSNPWTAIAWTDGNFRVIFRGKAPNFTGERMTTGIEGQ